MSDALGQCAPYPAIRIAGSAHGSQSLDTLLDLLLSIFLRIFFSIFLIFFCSSTYPRSVSSSEQFALASAYCERNATYLPDASENLKFCLPCDHNFQSKSSYESPAVASRLQCEIHHFVIRPFQWLRSKAIHLVDQPNLIGSATRWNL